MKTIITSILLIVLSIGCMNTPPDQYCGCPEYKPIGTLKDFHVQLHYGWFNTIASCDVITDNDKIFIEGDICKNLRPELVLYKSQNRNTFYAICNPDINYTIKDKCEYEINDVNEATINALGIKNGKQ